MNSEQVLRENIRCALGLDEAELVIRNAMVLNVFTEAFERCDIAVKNGLIVGVESGESSYRGIEEVDAAGKYIVPGFIDGHIHIESALLSPKRFAHTVALHGTTAVVTDPHEISNVCGRAGFRYMLDETKDVPIDCYFMLPSCVPATPFDEAGAVLNAQQVEQMLDMDARILGLAELMNYPGLLACDEDILRKLAAAQSASKLIDGHAPGLTGKALNAYVASGVRSDHECTDFAEAREKLARGMWIMIREGTAGKNLQKLMGLFEKPYADRCMLVTDDKHPGELARDGHIDYIIRKAITLGADPILAYKMASYNAARYFGLRRNGAISPGYYADFVLLDAPETVAIHAVYKRGKRVSAQAEVEDVVAADIYSTVFTPKIERESFCAEGSRKLIGLVPGEILTTDEGEADGVDLERDICKLAVIERHKGTGHMGVAYIKGYGLKRGAIATSVAHDSHNLIVAGTNDDDMAVAAMRIREMQGGMVVVCEGRVLAELQLNIAGLMCALDAEEVEDKLVELKAQAQALGVSDGIDPFMTLSFLSLPVIPALRLTTLGVVDVRDFRLVD